MWKVFGIFAAGVIAWMIVKESPSTSVEKAATPATSQNVSSAVTAPPKCTVSDFAIQGFSSRVFDDCRHSSCPALKLTGKLKNNCAIAAGAQIKIVAEDASGGVVDTAEGWPASTRNISAGADYAFDFGPLLTYRKNMKTFSVQVIDVRTWR